MRNFIKCAVLTMALALPAWAGNIGCPIAPPPGGREAEATTESAKTNDLGFPNAVSEITMTLLQSLLVLF